MLFAEDFAEFVACSSEAAFDGFFGEGEIVGDLADRVSFVIFPTQELL